MFVTTNNNKLQGIGSRKITETKWTCFFFHWRSPYHILLSGKPMNASGRKYRSIFILRRIMKLAIVGSRDFNNYDVVKAIINSFRKKNQVDMIVSGGALGVDTLAYRYAVEYGITFVCHPPKPEDGYPAKFFRRNLRIVEQSEYVIAFPKGKSTGTRHSISLAKRLKKGLKIVEIKNSGELHDN
jgi:hypothetical protein